MLENIRAFAYDLGLRPKPGNPLYSPSTHFRLKAEEAMRKVDWATITDDNRVERLTWKMLYMRAQFCIFCGTELQALLVDIKECPNECGRVHPDRDLEGVSVLVFEPATEDS
jgi:hypothetical protein